jgi:uncharacterized protein (TIGR02117 family)
MLAALVGSIIPVNADWEQSDKGHAVYIYDNGVHTSIIFPRDIAAAYPQTENWLGPPVEPPELIDRIFEPPSDVLFPWQNAELERPFPGDPAIYPFLMVGWGDARFYRDTPSWADFRPDTAFSAVVGSGKSLIHADRITQLPRSGVRKLRLTTHELSTIMWFIRKQLKIPAQAAEPVPQAGYGEDDRFFEASDEHRYSGLFTCNNWVSEALKSAGVKTGYWTPLPFGVLWWH